MRTSSVRYAILVILSQPRFLFAGQAPPAFEYALGAKETPMAAKSPFPPGSTNAAESDESFVVSWKYPDGTLASGHPLPRERAEALCRIYSRMYPEQTYWLEPLRLTDTDTREFLGVRRKSPAKRKQAAEGEGG